MIASRQSQKHFIGTQRVLGVIQQGLLETAWPIKLNIHNSIYITMTDNQANEINRIMTELTDDELIAVVKETKEAIDGKRYFEDGGWFRYLQEKISVVMGAEVTVLAVQVIILSQAAKRFVAQKTQE